MKKVITYGTYDLLHHGHIRLLERAKQLGDYLIVGVTSEDFDKKRGKINVQQSLMERVKAVKETGLADEIIIEEYEGQKIDDIIKYGIDIFTVGSDWKGYFDYLSEYCEVIYLDRTKGISSTELRSSVKPLSIGILGYSSLIKKIIKEISYVNGAEITHILSNDKSLKKNLKGNIKFSKTYGDLLKSVDAVYVAENPKNHYEIIKKALLNKKHVLYESPLVLSRKECDELFTIAKKNNLVLMEAIKTLYSQAYNRLILLAKSGTIGKVVSVDVTCTSLKQLNEIGYENITAYQNSICAWGPIALLPILHLLGTNYESKKIESFYLDKNSDFDLFTKINFSYEKAVASIKVGKGVKSEGELIISGTKGYIYVPSPWWKTDYFEIRYEDQNDTKRYFYNLDGEGIRNELVTFSKTIKSGQPNYLINNKISKAIVSIIEDCYRNKDKKEL